MTAKFHSILILPILSLLTIPLVYASEDNDWTDWQEETEINVSIIGNTVIDLDSQDRLIRAYVEISNFDPRDGYYFMKIIQPLTSKTIVDQEILIREKGNDKAGADVAYMLNDDIISDNGTAVKGDYEIVISTEFGDSKGSAIFSVIKPSDPKYSDIDNVSEQSLSNQDEVENVSPIEIDSEPEQETIQELQSNSEIDEESTIPDWVRSIFILYADGSITENELINAIKFLIEQEIIII